MHLENRFLFLVSCFLLLAAACGGGDGASSAEESEAETEGEGEEGEGVREGEGESEAESECDPEDCDDGVECTDDSWNGERCACAHVPLQGLCDPPLICRPNKGGCVHGEPCADDSDCPDLDPRDDGRRGSCMQEHCDRVTASCAWRPLDQDDDNHPPQTCAEVLGPIADDCNDALWEEDRCNRGGWRDDKACQGSNTYPGAYEDCDGFDNDCDGVVDNRAEECGTDVGECVSGLQTCVDGEWSSCVGEVRARNEICDGEDNDCDGEVDEGWLNACGECGPAPAEVCNGVDDDCDGRVDEGVLNACGECGPVPTEVCDGEDNDCDGEVDENPEEICDDDNPCTRDVCDGGDCVSSLSALCDEIFSFECCRESADDCRWYMGDSGFCGSRADPPCERLDWSWCREIVECAWEGGDWGWCTPFNYDECTDECRWLGVNCCEYREDCRWYMGDDGFCFPRGEEVPCDEFEADWCAEYEACRWTGSACVNIGRCGDGACNPAEGEECSTCPEDCGVCPFCGDSTCDTSESCADCPEDCGVCPSFCGDSTCDADESCADCPVDCGVCPCAGECGALRWVCCNERADCRWYMGDAGFCGNADSVPCAEFNEGWCREYAACVWEEGRCWNR